MELNKDNNLIRRKDNKKVPLLEINDKIVKKVKNEENGNTEGV